jgi:hypothetical protein
VLDPDARQRHDRTSETLKRQLDGPALDAALNAGRALAPQEALDLALEMASEGGRG